MRVSPATPAFLTAVSNRLIASLATLLFSSRCSSIRSTGTPPSVPSGITGS
jgi:hypothetical protein